jgi:hypothetical protein
MRVTNVGSNKWGTRPEDAGRTHVIFRWFLVRFEWWRCLSKENILFEVLFKGHRYE